MAAGVLIRIRSNDMIMISRAIVARVRSQDEADAIYEAGKRFLDMHILLTKMSSRFRAQSDL